MRYFLPAYFIVSALTVFVLRTYLVGARTGINPVAEKWRDDVRGYIARWLVVLAILVIVNITLFALDAQAYRWLLPMAGLETTAVQAVAVVLLVTSLVWIAVAQAQMGDSWRIGIDPDTKTTLVSQGVFTVSRNPIFLGMRITLAGLFLANPNVLSLLVAVVGDVLIQVQVRVEEQYLESVHGRAYLDYKVRVPRWLLRWPKNEKNKLS
jgi:protein-S-isoprenylcysteine O-methyltransferase Ste14